MKKLLFLIASIVLGFTAIAQDMNRVVLHTGYTADVYSVENLDSITFTNVEGVVAAELELSKVSMDTLIVTITRTEQCESFKISVIPASVSSRFTDKDFAAYIEMVEPTAYNTDFTDAYLTGINLKHGADYYLATLAYDRYGVPCEVRKVEFKTPEAEIEGDPQVEIEFTSVSETEFTVRFTPNADVASYSIMCYEKGTMMQNFEQWSQMFGWARPEEMHVQWGVLNYSSTSHTWEDMIPGMEYEIYAQPLDANGNYAPACVEVVKTKAYGGEGVAKVAMELGDYKISVWGQDTLPCQTITFTPNDQTNFYKVGVYYKEGYDEDPAKAEEEMKTIMTQYELIYEKLETEFNIDPNKACVALACAQNSKGEWGPIEKLEFTTPATPLPLKAPAMKATQQKAPQKKADKRGIVPSNLNPSTGTRLSQF